MLHQFRGTVAELGIGDVILFGEIVDICAACFVFDPDLIGRYAPGSLNLRQMGDDQVVLLFLIEAIASPSIAHGNVAGEVIHKAINDAAHAVSIGVAIVDGVAQRIAILGLKIAGEKHGPAVLRNRVEIVIPVDIGETIFEPSGFAKILGVDAHHLDVPQGAARYAHGGAAIDIHLRQCRNALALERGIAVIIRFVIDQFQGRIIGHLRAIVVPRFLQNNIRADGII